MRKLLLACACALLTASALMVNQLSSLKPRIKAKGIYIPPYSYRHLLLLFPGMRHAVADAVFMHMCQLTGGIKFEKVSKEDSFDPEWLKIFKDLRAIHMLEPYFFDPYFMEAGFVWNVKEKKYFIKLINYNLEYGIGKCRNWMLPFFIGFNYFYFLNDKVKGAHYLHMAEKTQGAPFYLPFLVSRLYVQAGRLDLAIAVTQEQLKRAKGRKREKLKDRLLALKTIKRLSLAVEAYKSHFGTCPLSLAELVKKGFIQEVPEDPYGGEFYIDKTCKVWTTSNLRYQ